RSPISATNSARPTGREVRTSRQPSGTKNKNDREEIDEIGVSRLGGGALRHKRSGLLCRRRSSAERSGQEWRAGLVHLSRNAGSGPRCRRSGRRPGGWSGRANPAVGRLQRRYRKILLGQDRRGGAKLPAR